jgi:chromosome segregation ATPase
MIKTMKTRSASSSKSRKQVKVEESASDSGTPLPGNEIDVQDHLTQAQQGVVVLLEEVKALRERNEMLTAQLRDLRDAYGTSSKEKLRDKVQELKSDIRKLQKVIGYYICLVS